MNDDKTLVFVNLSSTLGKSHQLQYDHNYEILDYLPLPEPSFAKLDSEYIIPNFQGLLQYFISRREKPFDITELLNIIALREKLKNKIDIKRKYITEDDFKQNNTYGKRKKGL